MTDKKKLEKCIKALSDMAWQDCENGWDTPDEYIILAMDTLGAIGEDHMDYEDPAAG